MRTLAPVGATIGGLLGLGALLAGSASPAASPPGSSGSTHKPAALALPLNSSSPASGSTWAAVPMGHLKQPDNTFWQLFVLPAGRGRWRLVTPGGVADNGGITVGSGPDAGPGSLVVGFEASQLLGFSPLAATGTTGRRWQPGTIPSPLAPLPGSLAAAPDGRLIALTGTASDPGRRVVETSADTSGAAGWRALTTGAALAGAAAGRRCGLSDVDAVALAATGGRALVGGACSSAGEVGVFTARLTDPAGGKDVTSWRLVGPRVAGLSPSEVLRIATTGSRIVALAAETRGRETRLVVLSIPARNGRPPARARWSISRVLRLAGPHALVSTGTIGGGGFFAVFDAGASAKAAVLAGGDRSWAVLPPLPSATATVAFGAGGRIDALAVRGSKLLDYRLHKGGRRFPKRPWYLAQVISVPIQYGSSG